MRTPPSRRPTMSRFSIAIVCSSGTPGARRTRPTRAARSPRRRSAEQRPGGPSALRERAGDLDQRAVPRRCRRRRCGFQSRRAPRVPAAEAEVVVVRAHDDRLFRERGSAPGARPRRCGRRAALRVSSTDSSSRRAADASAAPGPHRRPAPWPRAPFAAERRPEPRRRAARAAIPLSAACGERRHPARRRRPHACDG